MTPGREVLEACLAELSIQLKALPGKAIVRQALAQSKAVLLEDLDTCMAFSNGYAPEHLIIATNQTLPSNGFARSYSGVSLESFLKTITFQNLTDVAFRQIPLYERFQIDPGCIPDILAIPALKLIFICSPNNPTGNVIDRAAVERLLEQFQGIVVVDEAYIGFCEQPSWKKAVKRYPNLIGMAFADARIIELFNKIKPPYNISALN